MAIKGNWNLRKWGEPGKIFSGTECKTCGGTTRYTCNRGCVVCVRETGMKYRAKRKALGWDEVIKATEEESHVS